MYHELQRTDRVCHALEVVRLTVCKVIHWIYVPTATCAVVRVGGDDTIHDWIAEVHVWISHVNLRTKHHLAVLNLAILHSLEEAKVLINWTITIWRSYTRLCRCTFLLGYLLSCLLVDVCLALFDKLDGKIIELLEIVRSVVDIAPLKT